MRLNGVRTPIYRFYERRLRSQVAAGRLPRHVGLVIDGNRRWARQVGLDNPSIGHRRGAEHIDEVLAWCRTLGIDNVTIYIVSVDNLRKRHDAEVTYLLGVIEEVVTERLARTDSPWQVHLAGRLDVLPDSTAHALKLAEERSRGGAADAHVTLAIGYDGRLEVVDALRSLLDAEARAGATAADLATRITDDAIAAHLYTAGRPDPELIIRTSGEQRLSGFLLWQSVHSELYFCDTYWPAFREVDFLRALRDFGRRDRRFGK